MSNFLGVKYIGNKQKKEDTLFKTGAVWTPGQIINFDSATALALAKHTDTFELADVQEGGALYETVKNAPATQLSKEPIGYFNVETMDAEALNVFSMRHFGRSIDQTKTIEQIREEVIGLARVEAVFDNELHVEAGKDKHFIALLVNDEDYASFKAGKTELVLVVKPVQTQALDGTQTGGSINADEGGDDNTPTREKLESALVDLPAEVKDVEGLINQLRDYFGGLFTAADEAALRERFKPVEQQVENTADKTVEKTTENTTVDKTKSQASADPLADLKADLEKLETKDLREMCKKYKLPVSNTMKKDVLIAKLLAAAEKQVS